MADQHRLDFNRAARDFELRRLGVKRRVRDLLFALVGLGDRRAAVDRAAGVEASRAVLAASAGLSVATVRRALAEAVSLGLVEVEPAAGEANRYRVNLDVALMLAAGGFNSTAHGSAANRIDGAAPARSDVESRSAQPGSTRLNPAQPGSLSAGAQPVAGQGKSRGDRRGDPAHVAINKPDSTVGGYITPARPTLLDGRVIPKARPWRVGPSSLSTIEGVARLYLAALAKGWLTDSDATRAQFLCVAVHVRETERNTPGKLLTWLIRHNFDLDVAHRFAERARQAASRFNLAIDSLVSEAGRVAGRQPALDFSEGK
jgi:hypothetical protein